MRGADFQRRFRRERSGMALVLVMCLLVLLACLFMGYFSSITAERLSARNFAATNDTRQLADSAVNIVMAQIVDATTRRPDDAWTSQPGLIRTFDDSGGAVAAYKLYSSDKMVVSGNFNARAAVAQEVPSDWESRRAEFIDLNAPSKRAKPWRYPIVDPAAANQVEGFSLDPKWSVAMTVRWIYVLRDGQLATPVAVSKAQVKVSAASEENPVVGRIAFWTDDESCKVNINTASEGVFWDAPRTQSQADQTLDTCQPQAYEYSRFPGHPATVCLSAVWPSLVGSGQPRNESIYALTPRVAAGGSREGTVALAQQASVPDDKDRLFASLDEIYYSPQRTASAALSADEVDRARFFVTPVSRSPELNLFNRPRVSLWPVPYTVAKRTSLDALMALCSTVPGANNTQLYFTRQEARSQTLDYTGDANNGKLYQYLQQLTAKPVPGFGGDTLESKYGGAAGRDQILTEIFDFVRCVNLSDPSAAASDQFTTKTPGQVLPITIGSTRGLGRFPTLAEVAVQFYAQSVDSKGQTNKMGAVLLLSLFNPAQGYRTISKPDYVLSVATKKAFQIDGVSTYSFSGDIKTVSLSLPTEAVPLGGAESFARLMGGSYPYAITGIPVANGAFAFGGGTIEVTFRSNTSPAQTLQTIEVELPAVSGLLSAPKLPSGTYASWNDYSKRLSAKAQEDAGFFKFDVVRSVVAPHGDPRLIAGRSSVSAASTGAAVSFGPADAQAYQDVSKPVVCSLVNSAGRPYDDVQMGTLAAGAIYAADAQPAVPVSVPVAGDWDNGVAGTPDGAYIGKPDEGGTRETNLTSPYFSLSTTTTSAPYFFSQRQMASPVALGSLPTGVVLGRAWETLLFNPHPAAGSGHPGLTKPYDFLWLDLFCVPTVQPYALSTPLGASGRVNLNYEMVPFTGMQRTTAVRAALKSTTLFGVPTGEGSTYKKGTPVPSSYYYDISADETLKGMDQRFAAGSVYRSAAEICGIELVIAGETASSMSGWWQAHALTGDNGREMPYNHLYPLFTTQSNVYQVHCRAQSLLKAPNSDPQIWDENRDTVRGEYRGASVIERWIDPADTRLQSVDIFEKSLTPYYRFRVVSTLPFVP